MAIIALISSLVSAGTGIWGSSIPMDKISNSERVNTLTGDLKNSGYASNAVAGVDSEVDTTVTEEEGGLKKTLGDISRYTGVFGSLAGSASNMSGAKVPVTTT